MKTLHCDYLTFEIYLLEALTDFCGANAYKTGATPGHVDLIGSSVVGKKNE